MEKRNEEGTGRNQQTFEVDDIHNDHVSNVNYIYGFKAFIIFENISLSRYL